MLVADKRLASGMDKTQNTTYTGVGWSVTNMLTAQETWALLQTLNNNIIMGQNKVLKT